jgi:hypothetical protein
MSEREATARRDLARFAVPRFAVPDHDLILSAENTRESGAYGAQERSDGTDAQKDHQCCGGPENDKKECRHQADDAHSKHPDPTSICSTLGFELGQVPLVGFDESAVRGRTKVRGLAPIVGTSLSELRFENQAELYEDVPLLLQLAPASHAATAARLR